MRYSLLITLAGWIAVSFTLAMVPVALIALLMGDMAGAMVFLISGLLLLAMGGAMLLVVRGTEITLSRADFCLGAVMAWVYAGLAASLPFLLASSGYTLIDAWFEAVSWLTTTGAPARAGSEILPVLVWWRAGLQWLGGFAAILTAFLVLVPMGIGGMDIKPSAFAPAANGAAFARQFRQILRLALLPYLTLTFACFLSLLAAGTEAEKALMLALSALATGNLDPAGTVPVFSPLQLFVLALFLIAGALGLLFHRSSFSLSPAALWHDSEARAFLLLTGLTMGLFLLVQLPENYTPAALVAHFINGFYVAASLLSTSAFLPYEQSQFVAPYSGIVMPLILLGGASLSTAGGLKILRFLLLAFYQGQREIAHLLDPNSVVPITLPSGIPLKLPLAESVWTLFLLAIFSLSVLSLFLALAGMDFPTSLAASAAAIANAGPALYLIDPTAPQWSALAPAAKFFLTLGMIAGRTDFLLAAALLVPSFWSR